MLKHRLCTDSLMHLCMTGHKGYGSEGLLTLGKGARKQILLSSFSLSLLVQLPTLRLS